jgi:hypothetical protein
MISLSNSRSGRQRKTNQSGDHALPQGGGGLSTPSGLDQEGGSLSNMGLRATLLRVVIGTAAVKAEKVLLEVVACALRPADVCVAKCRGTITSSLLVCSLCGRTYS